MLVRAAFCRLINLRIHLRHDMTADIAWKIVLIDDEEDIREVMSLALTDKGFEVLTAAEGQAGIRLCRQAAPQIVITDIRMPGMDGIQVLEILKKSFPEIEVIVATAYGEMDLAIRALQLDASDFITKPIGGDALDLALKRAQDRFISRKKLQDYTKLLEREKADQARILHQDKMMSLGRLAASVVHEINNPLSGILNYLRLMTRILNKGALAAEQVEKFKRYLDLAEKETARCSQIVSGLLNFSRLSPPSFGQVNIQELLQRSRLLSQHRLELSNIRLELDLPAGIPDIEGDFNQLQQCVINLIFNGMDAMPDGGTLYLSARYDSQAKEVIITVKDTGQGIGATDLPHIFEPFFTTKKEGFGVGLGLSTVYGIIERHKGEVRVESRPGEGAVFMLHLPPASTDSPLQGA
jgi:signal transduction histidine kinase